MRTMFTLGFASRDTFWLGQEEPALSKADRDSILENLSAAWKKAAVIDQWRDNHPSWQSDLGDDLSSFIEASNNASVFVNAGSAVRQTLANTDPSAWYVSTPDLNDASTWAVFVDKLYSIVQRHPGTKPAPTIKPAEPVRPSTTNITINQPPPAPGTTPVQVPAAAAPSQGPNPLLIGVGAVTLTGLLILALK